MVHAGGRTKACPQVRWPVAVTVAEQALMARLTSNQQYTVSCKHAPGFASSLFNLNHPPPHISAVKQGLAAERVQDSLTENPVAWGHLRDSWTPNHMNVTLGSGGTGDILADTGPCS